ncbi:MAG: GNAT family N-acetyltransferase [Terriglobales bacterium]
MMPAIQIEREAAVKVTRLNPLRDPRWRDLLTRHPDASVFHTPEWLETLHRTYGYKPVAYTTAPAGAPLGDGLVCCHVRSWITGHRLVSVPFSDHCQPLLGSPAAWDAILTAAVGDKGQFLEVRPLRPGVAAPPRGVWDPVRCYVHHTVDLSPPPEALLRSFDESCVRRRVRRAQRAQLDIRAGRSPELIQAFFALHAATRRRHGLPPQPLRWFANLAACCGKQLCYYVAFYQGRPIAAIVTLLFRQTLTYKYGASDAAFHQLGAMPFLLWQAIQEGKRQGATCLDLGRSEADNPGLLRFKDNWNGRRQQLIYYRFPEKGESMWASAWAKGATSILLKTLPVFLLAAIGDLAYRHFG